MSVEGGLLIFGVAEPEDGVFELAPKEIGTLPERLSQIARSSVQPPVHVNTTPFRKDGERADHGLVRFYGSGQRGSMLKSWPRGQNSKSGTLDAF